MCPATRHSSPPRRPAGKLRRWLGGLALLLVRGAVLAADAGSGDPVDEARLAVPDQSGIPAAASAWRLSHSALPVGVRAGATGPPGASPVRTVQTMVWTARPLLQLGLGIERRWPQPSSVSSPAPNPTDAGLLVGLLVGLRLDAGPRAHLTWEAPLWRPETSSGDGQTREMRVALALTPQDPYADLRRGLLTKVELSGQTTLALRPRGRRIGLLLTSHW